METVLAIKGDGFVMMASTSTVENHGLLPEKCILHPLSDFVMMTFAGVTDGGSLRFMTKILRKLTTFEACHGYSLNPSIVMHYSRQQLARHKRYKSNNKLSIMIGGFDSFRGPSLYAIDNSGMACAIPYGVRGTHPEYYDTVLEMNYKPNLSQEGAYMVLKECVDHIKTKHCFPTFNFEVFVIKKGGTKRYYTYGDLPMRRTFSRRMF